MLNPAIPQDEEARIAALRILNILDTEPEERFDRLTRMAKRLFSVPIATVTLVDTNRQWFKSQVGLTASETPRNISICAHTILGEGIFTVPDTLQDERFIDNPLVTGDPNIRFYAGCSLKIGEQSLGTLCVIDREPREFGREERELLMDLAEMAERELVAVQLASTDHLTQLSNRRGFETLTHHALSVCRRMQRPATVLLFDLNHFKGINDTFGHAEGDRALKAFAQGLLVVFRNSDVIGRLGGDEFAVLMTGSNAKSSASAISRLREWLVADRLAHGRLYGIEFSVGEIEFDAVKLDSIETLLDLADAAMYQDKRESRKGADTSS